MEIGYTQEELQRVKCAELSILKKTIECCEELHITYFLAYGTALGAVRHKGFIPWDDDIDIGLTRDNYERFLREAPKWFEGSEMFVEHLTTEKQCPYTYAKVKLNGTKFIEYCHRNIKCHHGVFIDVFPFDELPASVQEQKKQYDTVQKLARYYVYRQTPDISEKPTNMKLVIKQIVRRIIHYLLLIKSVDSMYAKLTEEMIKYNDCNSGIYGCLFYPKFKAGCMTKDMVTNLKKIKFENMEANVPADIEKYLESQYGDYMTLPPVEERVGHRPYKVEI